MPTLFGVDIAGIIGSQLGPQVLPATLHVRGPSSRNPLDLSAGNTSADVDHACRGFTEIRSSARMAEGVVREGGRVVTILGGTLPAGVEPKSDHGVTIEGIRYRIVEVVRDPAAATYVCQVSSP